MMKKLIILSSLLLVVGCSSNPKTVSKKNSSLKPSSKLTYNVSAEPMKSRNEVSSLQDLRKIYQKWRGTPYRYGGVSEHGMDCSAFTRTMYQEAYGMSLPRSTYEQVELGRQIAKSELRPGDLVFFRTGGGNQHNGVYVGDGSFAHASSSVGVTISRLDNVYWRSRYWQSRRLL